MQLNENISSQVKLGNGNIQKVEGRGTSVVYTIGSNKKLIHDVLYVPRLTQKNSFIMFYMYSD